MPKKLCVGAYVDFNENIFSAITTTRNAGFDFIVSDLIDNGVDFERKNTNLEQVTVPPYWSDLAIPQTEWNYGVIGVLSNVNEQLDKLDDPLSVKRAKDLLISQINYSHHVGLCAVIIEIQPANTNSLAQIISSKLLNLAHGAGCYWVKIKMQDDVCDAEYRDRSSWHRWDEFRTICGNDKRVAVVLEFPPDIPDEQVVKRWLGEPVKCIILHKDIFQTNGKGCPVLSKAHQNLLKKFFAMQSQVIITVPYPKDEEEVKEIGAYKKYIDFIWNIWNDEMMMKCDGRPYYTAGYEDFLQCPLQPLMDNLESHTYEVFEKDPTKYNLYEEAIYEALIQRVPEEAKDTTITVVMVVGAGRGPIVCCALSAANRSGRKIKAFAIEKNFNAISTLIHCNGDKWENQVTVVHTDMRDWETEERADIMVSELLGSFGDNELSPECLDGAQKFLKDDGIMIPQSYTSYIAPIMTPKLYMDVKTYRDPNKFPHSHFETPYVVQMLNKYDIDEPKELFTFKHPNPNIGTCAGTNDRWGILEFKANTDCVMHGVAGYFDSVLYGKTHMGILPEKHSPGMFSWFPIFFPLRNEIKVQKGDKIVINFWRCSSKSTVWYEWCVATPTGSNIHNINGRAYTIGL